MRWPIRPWSQLDRLVFLKAHVMGSRPFVNDLSVAQREDEFFSL